MLSTMLRIAILGYISCLFAAPVVSQEIISLPSSSPEFPLPVERFNQEWRLTDFTDEAGLSDRNIFHFDFEADGSIWAAASDGLYFYDGYVWQRFGMEDGLPSNFVRTVSVASNGDLWVGTDRGAGVFQPGEFDSRGAETGLAGLQVRRIKEIGDAIWFCCDRWPSPVGTSGLSKYENGEWTTYTTEDGLPSDYLVDILQDSQGRLFAATMYGVAIFEGDRWVPSLTLSHFPQINLTSSVLGESRHGVFLTSGPSTYLFRDDEWIEIDINVSFRYGATVTHDRDVIVNARISPREWGFHRWVNNLFVRESAPFPPPSQNYTEYIAEAPDGSIWSAGYS